jgi:hypothetical protein
MTSRETAALMLGVALLLSAGASTAEPDPEATRPADLVGIWVLAEQEAEGVQVFARAASLTGDQPGYAFGPHGGLVVRQAGWCATPTMTWSNLEGLWRLSENRLLDIHHPWRNGPRAIRLEIVSLTQRRLVCRVRTDPGSAGTP